MDPAEVVKDQIPKKKIPLTPVLLAIIIILIGIIAWVMLSQKSNSTPTTEKTATNSAKTKTPTPKTAATTETPVVDDTTLITKALVAKTGIAADIIDVTISTKTDTLAKGLVSAKGEMGGGYYLAAKVNGDWIIVFDGQSTPDCASVNPYNFPASMVPECVDSSGNIVTR